MAKRSRAKNYSEDEAPPVRTKRRRTKQLAVYPDLYAVESIHAAKMEGHNKWVYCVKWHGWPLVESEWEPQQHLINDDCERLLESFWAMVGGDEPVDFEDNEDSLKPKKRTIIAPREWYHAEIAYYKRAVKDKED